MGRVSYGIAGVLAVAALVGLLFAPAASATRYDFDITKTIRGYTVHVAGWIDVDTQARTITGHIHVTVTEAGKVIFDKVYDFTFTWSSRPAPMRMLFPAAGVLVTISFSGLGGIDVTASPVFVPGALRPQHHQLNRVQ